MEKYHNSDDATESRVQKNRDLYSQSNLDIDDNLDIDNNVTLIDSNTLSKIINKDKDKNTTVLDDYFDYEDEVYENTKEYDLKKIIDDAHKGKNADYESTRFKKVRESEYEILKDLNVEKKEEDETPLSREEQTLVDLIKTVEMNALKRNEEKQNDLMGELIGNSDTEVLEPVNVDDEDTDATIPKPTIIEELEKTKQLSRGEIVDAINKEENLENTNVDDNDDENTKEIPLENSFYTGNLSIKKHDLDDFKDLQKELKGNNLFVKILIVIIVIIVLAVGLYLCNKYFNLGLF